MACRPHVGPNREDWRTHGGWFHVDQNAGSSSPDPHALNAVCNKKGLQAVQVATQAHTN